MADELKRSETALVQETLSHENTKKKVPQLETMIVERDGQIDFLTKVIRVGVYVRVPIRMHVRMRALVYVCACMRVRVSI